MSSKPNSRFLGQLQREHVGKSTVRLPGCAHPVDLPITVDEGLVGYGVYRSSEGAVTVEKPTVMPIPTAFTKALSTVIAIDEAMSVDEAIPLDDHPKVHKFPGATRHPLPPDQVLAEAKGKLGDVLVIGWDENDDLYFAASGGTQSVADANWLLTVAKDHLLDRSRGEDEA